MEDPHQPSTLSCPPTQAYLSSHLKKGDIVLGVKALDDSHSERQGLALMTMNKWGSVFGIFFSCLKKRK